VLPCIFLQGPMKQRKLTLRSRPLLDKLMVVQLLKKFPEFPGNLVVCYYPWWFPFWAKRIQFTPSPQVLDRQIFTCVLTQKATTSFVISVCPSAYTRVTPDGIYWNVHVSHIYYNCQHIPISGQLNKNKMHFTEDVRTFMISLCDWSS
jgi:hypothetical protein